jgi:Lon protease-like protein
VREVLRLYDDGRMDIVVEGGKRYEVVRFHDDKAPYFVGTVVYAGDQSESDPALLVETVSLYNKMMSIVHPNGDFHVVPDGTDEIQSFRMAQKAGLELAARQRLLEENSETARLQWLLGWFREVLPKLENAAEISRIVRNDGYL